MTDPQAFDEALILTGPTASGKSAVGLALAERLGAEVVAMDSMTLYRGLDIGTAKPTPDERRRVPHHLIDVLDPWESASVAWWLDRAAAACRDVAARGRRALFVGGTPLYLKALLHGLFEGPAGDPVLRARLEREPGPELHARLALVDPASAARLHPHDVRRLVRALEVFELTGRPISSWQDHFDKVRPRRFPPVWLDLARPVLYERINRRVAAMMRAGLLDEVRRLRALPRPLSKEARQALGYKELFDHLEGRIDLEGAVGLIQTRSRQFAKRQLTWLRHMPGCQALPVAGDEPPDEVAGRVQQIWFPAS